MTLVECVPIGVIRMMDQGSSDAKIIAVCAHDPFYSNYKDIKELPNHVFEEIKHFSKFIKHWKEKTLLFLLLNQRNKLLKKLPIRLKDIIKNLKVKEIKYEIIYRHS